MGIYTNVTALRKDNLSVVYENLPATVHLAGQNYVTLVFKSDALDPLTMTNEELEQSFNTSLFITSGKESSKAHFNLTPKKNLEIKRKETYLKTLYEIGGRKYFVGGKKARIKAIDTAAKLLGDEKPPCPKTLSDWVKLDELHVGGLRAHIAGAFKLKRESKFSVEIRLLAIEFTMQHYLGKLVSLQSLYNDFIEEYKDEFDELPCRQTYSDWMDDLIDPEMLKKGLSQSERKKLQRNALQKFKVSRPLERVEADGASISIGLIDDEGNYLGSFTIIFMLDVHTRCILGYELHIGSGEPASTVISAYRHSICPKTQGSYYSQFGNTWFCYGVPELLVVDGGSGFISRETHAYVLKTTGSEIEVLSSYSPWLKPFVERFIGTFRGQCASMIGGHVGKQKDQKKLEYKIKDRATHTIEEVRRFIEMWIVDDYHHTPHSGLNGLTPAQKWQKALDNGWAPTVPVDMDNVMLPGGNRKEATISGDVFHLGVTVNRVRYNDDEGRLKEIGLWLKSRRKKTKVTCLYSDDDLSAITVVCPINGDEFRVEAISDSVTPGMSTKEFAVKNPSLYKNKGAKKVNSMAKHPEVQAGQKAVNSTINTRKSSKTRAASPEETQRLMDEMNTKEPQITDECPYDIDNNSSRGFTAYESD